METWPRILTATITAMIVTYIELYYNLQGYTLTMIPFTLIGIALGISLGFRNNASYDRFWEGRKLWGELVNASRNLTRHTYFVLDSSESCEKLQYFRQVFVKRLIAFAHALRCHLRNEDPKEEISRFLPPEDCVSILKSTHRPLAILQQLGRDLALARKRRWLHEFNLPFMNSQVNELSNILGACERIQSTPIPLSYSILIHRIVASYCFLLPFGLIGITGALTPVVVFLISYVFFGLDAIGDEIEDPFGLEPNDLPLKAISRNIEINLLELINESDRLEPLKPKNGILM